MRNKDLKEGMMVSYIKKHYNHGDDMFCTIPINAIVINITAGDVDEVYNREGLYLVAGWDYYTKQKDYKDKKHYSKCLGHVDDFPDTVFTLLFENCDRVTTPHIKHLLT